MKARTGEEALAVKVSEKQEPTQMYSRVISDTLGDCLGDTIPEGHMHLMNPCVQTCGQLNLDPKLHEAVGKGLRKRKSGRAINGIERKR